MRPSRRPAALLFLVGVGLLLHGAWLPLKAAVGQHLLQRAWARTVAGEAEARPWPWADTRPVARLEAPRLGVSQVVLEGASGAALAWAPGWLAGSAAPGGAGSVVISGHRDTHFGFLADLAVGDELWLATPDGRRGYRVVDARVVDTRREGLRVSRLEPELLLVTCYPFRDLGPSGPLRYLVRAVPLGTGTG